MRLIGAVVLLGLLSGCASSVEQAVVRQAIKVSDQTRVKPIAITKVAANLRRGAVVGRYAVGMACSSLGSQEVKWRSGNKIFLDSEDLVDVFRDELEANGWPVVGSTEDLFTGYDVSGAEVLVAARITDLESEFCAPLAGFGNFNTKGSMRVGIEWQVYSPARRTLIGKIDTEGSARHEDTSDDTGYELLAESFAVAANNLLASDDFYSMVERSSAVPSVPSMEEATVIENTYAPRRTREEALEAARRSTVTVRRAAGYGSGFAIGDGALVLTNAHVVGNADRVALVTASGLELDAEVVARDTGRDVALLRVGSGVRLPPLYIDDDLPSAGATVFAVGSPLTESLSGTVTSGIVSGTRLLDGVNWIQSDVAVSPGNSGGPVLNEQGAVVAISTAGFQAGGSQVGLNLLIPIREALAYLELRLPVESQRD